MSEKPSLTLDFVYRFCHDIDAMREFYTDFVGLEETVHANEEGYAFIGYKCGSLTMYFLRGETVKPEKAGWTKQLGYSSGSVERTSYSIGMSERKFRYAVKRLRKANVEAFSDVPLWLHDEYWSYIVQDPMGVTIEIHTKPIEKPPNGQWSW
ncbi:MAG: VOC family protein [Promethearchaeota archaeon]